MKTLNTFIVLATLAVSLQSFAAIGCRPDMNCGIQPQEPSLPGTGINVPELYEMTVIGYAEIPSPRCDDEDLVKAKKIAKNKATSDAHFWLGKDAVITQKFWFTENCEQGTSAESVKGNSWIVQAFAKFEKKN